MRGEEIGGSLCISRTMIGSNKAGKEPQRKWSTSVEGPQSDKIHTADLETEKGEWKTKKGM